MFYQSQNHLIFYDYVYGTRRLSAITDLEAKAKEKPTTPKKTKIRIRRSSLPSNFKDDKPRRSSTPSTSRSTQTDSSYDTDSKEQLINERYRRGPEKQDSRETYSSEDTTGCSSKIIVHAEINDHRRSRLDDKGRSASDERTRSVSEDRKSSPSEDHRRFSSDDGKRPQSGNYKRSSSEDRRYSSEPRLRKQISGSSGSTASLSHGISAILRSPFRRELLLARPVCSQTTPRHHAYADGRKTPSGIRKVVKVVSPPPSPAPKDPILEKHHRSFSISTEERDDDYEKPRRFLQPFRAEEISPLDPDYRFIESPNAPIEIYDSYYPTDLDRQPHYYSTEDWAHHHYGERAPWRSDSYYYEEDYQRPSKDKYRRREEWRNGRHGSINRSMGKMNPLEDHERKVIIEFCHLLEKSKQLFNGLRELPQYGHNQWHTQFGRTFDTYTKLWKFQQQHRALLDTKYGLKRWQIGEIASKIGQLYYHFYLRTSDTGYLYEAFSFYYAIRGRSYYTRACKEDKCELMVKKLRYYARFIVVCLLLKKMKFVKELTKELDKQVTEYGNTYEPDDHVEWIIVVDEVKAFVKAEPVIRVIHPDNDPIALSHRINHMCIPPVERSATMTLSLQEVLIIGSSSYQVRFSELTIDMYRMLQTLEREPTGEIQHIFDESPRKHFEHPPNITPRRGFFDSDTRKDNPHKSLLFKPSPNQILVYMASGCNDLPPSGALLLYISADGQLSQASKSSDDDNGESGGLITTSKSDIHRESAKDSKSNPLKIKEIPCFYPEDLYPFTRKPLFIIIDSDNSYAFQNIPRHFGQPVVVLMSPVEYPPSFQDCRQKGNLFTLFLHSPLTAFTFCCDKREISLVHWDRAQIFVDSFMAEASQLILRSRIDPMYITFMGDDFLRLLLHRFIFCEVTLRLHKSFRARNHFTRSSPQIPDDLFDHPALVRIVMDLALQLQVRNHFNEPPASGSQGNKE